MYLISPANAAAQRNASHVNAPLQHAGMTGLCAGDDDSWTIIVIIVAVVGGVVVGGLLVLTVVVVVRICRKQPR